MVAWLLPWMDQISQLDLSSIQISSSIEDSDLEPVLVYPCRLAPGPRRAASAGAPTHWLLQAHRGPPMVASLPGGACVWSDQLVPQWLVKRINCTDAEIIAEVRTSLPRLPLPGRAATHLEKYILPCTWPVRVDILCKDWEAMNGVEEILSFDSACRDPMLRHKMNEVEEIQSISTAMYCRQTGKFCQACDHDVECLLETR